MVGMEGRGGAVGKFLGEIPKGLIWNREVEY